MVKTPPTFMPITFVPISSQAALEHLPSLMKFSRRLETVISNAIVPQKTESTVWGEKTNLTVKPSVLQRKRNWNALSEIMRGVSPKMRVRDPFISGVAKRINKLIGQLWQERREFDLAEIELDAAESGYKHYIDFTYPFEGEIERSIAAYFGLHLAPLLRKGDLIPGVQIVLDSSSEIVHKGRYSLINEQVTVNLEEEPMSVGFGVIAALKIYANPSNLESIAQGKGYIRPTTTFDSGRAGGVRLTGWQ